MTKRIIRTYRFRLKPTRKQAHLLESALMISCEIYNAAMQERRDAWKRERKSVGYFDQTKQLTEIRALRNDVQSLPVEVGREPLRRVDRAFKAFFRRCKAGQKPGFPRFRSRDRYDSICVPFGSFNIQSGRILISKMGSFAFKPHRQIQGDPRQCLIKRLGKKWQVSIVCELGAIPQKIAVRNAVGIDVGVKTFATLSDGREIANPRWSKQSESQIAACNRSLARKKKGSRNRVKAKEQLRRAYTKAVNRRINFCHHVSKWLVSQYDLIAFEKLNIKAMTQGRLAKSIMDAAWGILLWQIAYKAESAGCYAIAVDPRGTTQKCSACGETVKKKLSERVHSCPKCGLILGRDLNAAHNILALGRSAVGLSTQESSTQF